MDNQEKKRVCKKCDNIKIVSLFGTTKNKKSKTQTHSHTCKACDKLKRQAYFKEYHKKRYVSKKKNKEDNKTQEVV